MLQIGNPVPWFECRAEVHPRFKFDTAAGRYLVLCFLGRASNDQAQAAACAFAQRIDIFNVEQAPVFFFFQEVADQANDSLFNQPSTMLAF